MKRQSILVLLVVLTAAICHGQNIPNRDRSESGLIYVESHYIFSMSDTASVFVPYRIRNDFFVFTLSSQSESDRYSAKADIIVEILDSSGRSVTRQIDNIELTVPSNSIQDLRKAYFQGLMTFHLQPGKYTIVLRAEDQESKRTSPNIEKPLVIDASAGTVRSSFIPIAMLTPGSLTADLFNIGGDILFSRDFGFAFQSAATNPIKATLSLQYKPSDDDDDLRIIMDTTITCTPFLSHSAIVVKDSNTVRLSFVPDSTSNMFIVPLQGSHLRQGRYVLSATLNDTLKRTISFSIRWLDMPASLNDLDIATLPLQYLLTKDEYSAVRRGSRESRISKFDEFWKKKDPTPGTAYNEMMAEFYRRVDYAIGAFRTLKELNGSMTDRGKIYILYGNPSAIDRTLLPGSPPKEIWSYDNIRKTFVFEDQSRQGNYKLIESK